MNIACGYENSSKCGNYSLVVSPNLCVLSVLKIVSQCDLLCESWTVVESRNRQKRLHYADATTSLAGMSRCQLLEN